MSDLAKFNQLQADLTVFVAPVKQIAVINKATSEQASSTLREVKSFERKVEELRKQLVGPLNEQVKRINEFAKTITAPLSDAERHIKAQLLEFERVLEKEREAERAKEAEERKKREAEALALIQEQAEEVKAIAESESPEMAAALQAKAAADATRIAFEAKKAHWDASKDIAANKVDGVRRTWKFEVEEPGKVPVEFLSVDEKKIKAAVAYGVRDIPGVRIFQEASIAVR